MYKVPEEYYFRIHHVRPRFKGDIENVLLFMATEISKMEEMPEKDFANELNNAIRRYPGNGIREIKTINNWRTEISALFGYFIVENGTTRPGKRAIELAQKEDLVEAFKTFLYTFQYPGAHIKTHEVLKQIEKGVHFKPAQYILQVLDEAEKDIKGRVGLSKEEVCHCIFNDLRATALMETPLETWKRIKHNRELEVEYDSTGDVVRYAGDIVDYMEIANLLVSHDSRCYYKNTLESETILKFINSSEWYSAYDKLIQKKSATLENIKDCVVDWFKYVNKDLADTDFTTDILAFIANDTAEYKELQKSRDDIFAKLLDGEDVKTKDIGDIGESLVHSHECQRIKIGGREDLIHLIKRIPTQFAVGYDIQSVEIDERKRYIEVKTTISSKPLHFNKIHLTPNEWSTANTTRDRYFVYRLMISKTDKKLYVIQDPVGLYKNDIIEMIPKNGAEITFNVDTAGQYEELLSWAN